MNPHIVHVIYHPTLGVWTAASDQIRGLNEAEIRADSFQEIVERVSEYVVKLHKEISASRKTALTFPPSNYYVEFCINCVVTV